MKTVRRFRRVFFKWIVCLLSLSQLAVAAECPPLKDIYKASTLAPHSIFAAPIPGQTASRSIGAVTERKEFLSIAFGLHTYLFKEKMSSAEAAGKMAAYSKELPAGFKKELLKLDVTNISLDAKEEVLYIPLAAGTEARIYGVEKIKNGAGLLNAGEKLLDRIQADTRVIDIVSVPDGYVGPGRKIDSPEVWRDAMSRLLAANSAGVYRWISEKERERLNDEKVHREVFQKQILPKIVSVRAEDERSGRPSVITMGITGSAASGKTTIAESCIRELSARFRNVNLILFDDWLLQAIDRPIDPSTGKTTEDVFKKFDVAGFVRSIKAFIKGQDLLKPIYHQTAKGTLKLTLDDNGAPFILFGPKRNVFIVEDAGEATLSVRDETGKILESGNSVTLFDIPISVKSLGAGGEMILTVRGTQIQISPLNERKERAIQIIDSDGSAVKDMIDPGTGELIAEAGVTINKGGYIGSDSKVIDKPWKIKELIPYKDGVFIVEGILSLYDHPGQARADSLAELYTTSLFVDANFEVRLERGLKRERARAETLKGKPMPDEDANKYMGLFTQRKESLEDPFIYGTRGFAEFVGTTETRAESIFSIYRKGRLLSEELGPVINSLGIDPELLSQELERVEEDYIFNALFRSTVGGELRYERKIEGGLYDVYYLKGGIVLKIPRPGRSMPDMDILRERAGEVMIPTSFFDLSKTRLKIDGVSLPKVLIQNEVTPLDKALSGMSGEDAIVILDEFFDLQKKMWELGIVDEAVNFSRYCYVMTNQGRPAVLLFAVDCIGYKPDGLNPGALLGMASDLDPKIMEHYETRFRELINFTTEKNFGKMNDHKMLPRIYKSQLSSLQMDHISSLLLEYKTMQLWRLFKKIEIPQGHSAEIIWTRLWLDTIAKYALGANDAIETLYKELLKDPEKIKGLKVHELREHIFKLAPPLSRQDKVQVDKYLLYLSRIPLQMVSMGEKDGQTRSTMRIRAEIYDRMDPGDKAALHALLSHSSVKELENIIKSSGAKIMIPAQDDVVGEGRTIYMRLKKPVRVDDKDITLLRIKGARPVVGKNGRSVGEYKGRGSVSNVMESYASGSIIVRPALPDPQGTMFYQEALTEYELKERFNGSRCETDIPVGVGRYRALECKNKPVGYVICGMESSDHRLVFLDKEEDDVKPGSMALKNMVTGFCSDIKQELPGIFEDLGKSLRYFHDQGFVHRSPHIGNIGIKSGDTSRLKVVLRDLNNARDISTGSFDERTADRFLDVSRVLYDVLKKREYWHEDESVIRRRAISFTDLAAGFLKGYFFDMAKDTEEFKIICKALNGGFADRLEHIVADDSDSDYEELNPEEPYFGVLIKALRKAEGKVSDKNMNRPAVGPEPANIWPEWETLPREKRVLVFVSGGDCAINPFIGFLAAELKSAGMALAGVKSGLEGLVKTDLAKNILPISAQMASGMPYWSSIDFGSTRKSLVEGSPEMEQAIANIAATAGSVIVVGGNDHLNEAGKLTLALKERGVTVIAVPKTIDNDTLNTTALGVLSSSAIAQEEVYRAAAAQNSKRCVIVEVMGRNMGSLAFWAGNRYPDNFRELPIYMQKKIECSRPTIMTLVPEHAISIKGIRHQAGERMARYGGITNVTSEGFKLSVEDKDFPALVKNNPGLGVILKDIKEDAHHNIIIPQGVAAEFIAAILKEYNPEIEVLGFTPRGAIPTDRERAFSRDVARVVKEGILSKMTGFGAACSDMVGDKDRGVVKLVPINRISGKDESGRSYAKKLDQIATESDQIKAGVIVRPDQAIEEFSIVKAPAMLKIKSPMAVAKAVLSTAKSAWAHSRPSIIYIGGDGADKMITEIKEALAGVKDEGLAHDYGLVKDSIITLTGDKPMSLAELVKAVYEVNSKNKYVNIVLSGKFRISKNDPVIGPASSRSEELGARLKDARMRSPDPEYYIFDDKLKDLGQVVKLILLSAEPPSNEIKKMSDVRLTSLDSSLNMLPGEDNVADAESVMQDVNRIDRSLAGVADNGRMICHIIDPSLVPDGQEALITQINKITRSDDHVEKIIIGNRKETIEETIAKVLQKHPDAIIDAAVTDIDQQKHLEGLNILSLVFKPEEGRCNFRQIEGIIAALRAAGSNDRDSLLRIYEILTGGAFNDAVPENIRDLIRKLVFVLPAVNIEDPAEHKRLNENLVRLIESA